MNAIMSSVLRKKDLARDTHGFIPSTNGQIQISPWSSRVVSNPYPLNHDLLIIYLSKKIGVKAVAPGPEASQHVVGINR